MLRLASSLAAFALSLCMAGVLCAAETGTSPAEAPFFEQQIAPLLVRNCLECHNASDRQGGLALISRETLLAGGDSGPAVSLDEPDASLLLQRLRAGEMPPPLKEQPRPLAPDEIDRFAQWIAAGAVWPAERTLDRFELTTDRHAGRDWWSFQPLRAVPVPQLATAPQADGQPPNPIDAFIRARLSAEGLEPAPPADPRALARRLYVDLLGLPPTHEEVEAFAADPSPGAYEQLVDRLLASPHFGERWARYWLDVARYAETCGYERDQEKPAAWKYRDWVVSALNADLSYDRFVLEQLAGDELPDRSEQTVIATGFLRMGTWNDEPNDPFEYQYERLEDLIHTTSTAFLGLTVKCARCHDHKFDPIPQTDYYRMAAVFWAGYVEPRGAEWLGGPTRDELGFDVFGYTDRARDPPPLYLLRKGDPHRPEQEIPPGALSLLPALDQSFAPPPGDARTSHRRLQLARWITAPDNPLTPRVAVNRLWQHHFGAALVRTPDNFGFNGQRPTHSELLDWLARELVDGGWRMKPLHKLLVMSATYRQASLHPRETEYAARDAANLLCWRADRRRLDAEALRDAMLSVSGQLDLRLGGASFRPAISSDALEGLSMKGNAWQASPPEEQRRRSLYLFSKRSLLSPFMTAFDFCDTTQPCARRDVTTVAPQALALLNNDFVHMISQNLAARVAQAAPADRTARIEHAWRLALARQPTPREYQAALAHLEHQATHFASPAALATAHATTASAPNPMETAASAASPPVTRDPELLALESLCHVLINSNEFLYVD